MNPCTEYAALLDAYFDGECTPAEAEAVRSHLETCESCRAYLAELALLRDAFPNVDDAEVPADFTSHVMDAVRAHPRKRATPWKKTLLPMAACFALLVLAVRLPALQMNRTSAAPAAAPAMAMAPIAPAAAAEEAATEAVLDSTMVANCSVPEANGTYRYESAKSAFSGMDAAQEPAAPAADAAPAPEPSESQRWYAEVTFPADRIAEIPADWVLLEESDRAAQYLLTQAQLTKLLEELGETDTVITDETASLALLTILQDS